MHAQELYATRKSFYGLVESYIIYMKVVMKITNSENDKIALNNLVKFGIKVKSQRSLKNLTQDELSELSGVSKAVISRIENPNNFHDCKVSSVMKLAIALDISPQKFFDFSDLE